MNIENKDEPSLSDVTINDGPSMSVNNKIATLSLSHLNLSLNLSNKKRKTSFVSSFQFRNSFHLIPKSSCEFIENLSNENNTKVSILPSSDSINNLTLDNFNLFSDFKNSSKKNFTCRVREFDSQVTTTPSTSCAFTQKQKNRFKLSSQNRTNSLCELNNIRLSEEKFLPQFYLSHKTSLNNASNSFSSVSDRHDQLVPNKTEIIPKLEVSENLKKEDHSKSKADKIISFKNFESLHFYKQCNTIAYWFQRMNDTNKNNLLTMLMDYFGPAQSHLLSLKISNPHKGCEENCCDMIYHLPMIISTKIFSFLDPISLARACQVNRHWRDIGNQIFLWKHLCFLPKWRFSQASEEKQLQKYRDPTNQIIQWKSILSERFRVKRNWLTGKCFVKTFYGHEGAVSCVQFDDSRIVAGSAVGTIKVWNLDENNLLSSTTGQSSLMPYLNLVGHSKMIRCLHLDGNRLISGSADHTIKLWDLSEVHPTWSRVTCKMTFLGHTDKVRCLQVKDDVLISGSYDNTLKIWSIKTGLCKNTLSGHTDSVLCLQFDQEKIISGSADKTIRIWNFVGECLKELVGHKGSITCIHFDSHRIVSGSLDFDIRFWNINDGVCINTLNWITKEGHTGAIRCLKADNQKIVSCSDDKTIKIWNIETGERYVTLKNHSDGVTCLQFNDFYILSGSFDTTIKICDFSYF